MRATGLLYRELILSLVIHSNELTFEGCLTRYQSLKVTTGGRLDLPEELFSESVTVLGCMHVQGMK